LYLNRWILNTQCGLSLVNHKHWNLGCLVTLETTITQGTRGLPSRRHSKLILFLVGDGLLLSCHNSLSQLVLGRLHGWSHSYWFRKDIVSVPKCKPFYSVEACMDGPEAMGWDFSPMHEGFFPAYSFHYC
jgi:hypothetical protein